MSTINALVHHIDQLLTQHRALQHDYAMLQSSVAQLEEQLIQRQAANASPQEAFLKPAKAHNQNLEDDLNHLISLFDQATEAHHD